MSRVGKRHRPFRQGGKPIKDAPPEILQDEAPNTSWLPGRDGQGGEGLSEGYGGPGSDPTGPSGPEDNGREKKGSRDK